MNYVNYKNDVNDKMPQGPRDIGQLLRKFYLSKGLSQVDLAEKIGYSRSYISELVNGKRDLSEDFKNKFSIQFGFDINELYAYDFRKAKKEKDLGGTSTICGLESLDKDQLDKVQEFIDSLIENDIQERRAKRSKTLNTQEVTNFTIEEKGSFEIATNTWATKIHGTFTPPRTGNITRYKLFGKGISAEYVEKKITISKDANNFFIFVRSQPGENPYTLILHSVDDKGVDSKGTESNTILIQGKEHIPESELVSKVSPEKEVSNFIIKEDIKENIEGGFLAIAKAKGRWPIRLTCKFTPPKENADLVGYRLLGRGTSTDYRLKKTSIDRNADEFQLFVQVTKNDTPYNLKLQAMYSNGAISEGMESNTIMIQGVNEKKLLEFQDDMKMEEI